jgi:hypothetical protein
MDHLGDLSIMQKLMAIFRIPALAMAIVCASAHAESRVVTSLRELSSIGIAVERMQLSTPMASVEVGALVDAEKAPGRYELTECVVLDAAVSESKLIEVDTAAVGVARRSESTKARSIFLVRGKEVPNAYLAFQFSVRTDAGTQTRRYLLPVAKLANGS